MKFKERLDLLLVNKGFFTSREKARRYIMTGDVLVDDVPIDKPGTKVNLTAAIRLRKPPLRYVGRGGLKLEKGLEVFSLPLDGKIMLDIGASTGGFTDCALQHGAAKVYAVDVGYGQLAWSLRNSPQVVNLERTNMRDVTADLIPEPLDFVGCDVSFISVTKVLPPAYPLLKDSGDAVILIKPQFEAGPEKVGKGGVIKSSAVHREVLINVLSDIEQLGFFIWGLTDSPIRGADGNREFLTWLRKEVPSPNFFNWQQTIIQLTQ